MRKNYLLYKSNNHNYGQILVNNVVLLTINPILFNNKIKFIEFKTIKKLYNTRIISCITLNFLLNKKTIKSNSDCFFLQILTELGLESGILYKKCKNITFNKK
jgi:hypothetical protein